MKFFLIYLTMFLSVVSFSQGKVYKKIELKNGIIKKGELIKQDEAIITIKTEENQTLTFNKSNIFLISDFEVKQKYYEINKGYVLDLDFGINYVNRSNVLSIRVVNGYQVNKNFLIGIGVGIGIGNWFNSKYTLPTNLHFRYTLPNKKMLPFIFLNSGYTFSKKYSEVTSWDYYTNSGTLSTFKYSAINNSIGFGLNFNRFKNITPNFKFSLGYARYLLSTNDQTIIEPLDYINYYNSDIISGTGNLFASLHIGITLR